MNSKQGTYTVFVQKGEEPGTVIGQVVDEWGWEIGFVARWDGERRGYAGKGELGAVPPALRIARFDGPNGEPGGHVEGDAEGSAKAPGGAA